MSKNVRQLNLEKITWEGGATLSMGGGARDGTANHHIVIPEMTSSSFLISPSQMQPTFVVIRMGNRLYGVILWIQSLDGSSAVFQHAKVIEITFLKQPQINNMLKLIY